MKKQLTVICELPLAHRVVRVLEDASVSGYTMFEAAKGRGSEGNWDREGQLGMAGRMVMFVSILSLDEADHVVDRVYALMEPQMGIITLADVEVLRPDRF